MHGYCNTLNHLKVKVSILGSNNKIKSTIKCPLKTKVTLKNNGLNTKSTVLNNSIVVKKCLLNVSLTVHYNITYNTSDPYLYLRCLDGIVYTKNNKPILILK